MPPPRQRFGGARVPIPHCDEDPHGAERGERGAERRRLRLGVGAHGEPPPSRA